MIGVRIAKQYGAEVTGVDRALKLDMLRSIGFDHVIDYEREDFTRNGQRYDLILDTKTNRSTFRYLCSLNPGSRYVTVGGHLPRLLETFCIGSISSKVSGKQARVVALKPNKDLAYVNDLFEAGELECVVDGPYQLTDVPEAIQRFGEARHVGKIVIKVASLPPGVAPPPPRSR